MFSNWFALAIVTLLLWGVWGFFAKLAVNHINPASVFVLSCFAALPVPFVVWARMNFQLQMQPKGVLFAVLSTLTGTIGGVLFLYALGRGKASIVVTMTALSPLITILMSVLILRESITLRQAMGIALAIIAMVLFAG